jgi:putative phosphoesterase
LFDAAGVARVVHTGDITQPKTLDVLGRAAAPITGVYGNNDEREALAVAAVRLGIDLAPAPRRLDWGGRRITVVHDPKEHAAVLGNGSEVVLHGHDHRLVIERAAGRLVFNPGECAGHMAGLNAVGVLDLATLEVELLRF